MRLFLSLVIGLILAGQVQAQDANAGSAVALETQTEQASYAIGLNIGRELKRNGVSIKLSSLLAGISDILSNTKPRMSEEKCTQALAVYRREAETKMASDRKAAAEKNKREGEAFLAANAKKPGVKTLPSGLQYQVIKTGNGASPKLSDTVRTHYHGTFIDGSVFDSSVERNQPAEFPVNGVIRGWTEALQKMKVGDKWKLFVPSDLAYGPDGAAPAVGPHAVLIFEVELLEVVN